jgi:hypothetical protein
LQLWLCFVTAVTGGARLVDRSGAVLVLGVRALQITSASRAILVVVLMAFHGGARLAQERRGRQE